MARRLILLGDSIFDNAAYVQPGEPDVAAHLRERLPPGDWQVELRAVDGAIASEVPAQLAAAAIGQSDILVMSVGGNNALGSIALLSDPQPYPISEVLAQFCKIKESLVPRRLTPRRMQRCAERAERGEYARGIVAGGAVCRKDPGSSRGAQRARARLGRAPTTR